MRLQTQVAPEIQKRLLSRLLYQSENATRQTLFFGVFYWSQTIPTNTYCVKLFPQYYALISVNWGSI